jgi:FkbM family methyltransferase
MATQCLRQIYAARKLWGGLWPTMCFFLRSRRDHFLIGPTGGLRFGDHVFFVRQADWCAVEEVALADEYGFVKNILAKCHHNATVVDAGANIGMFSLMIGLLQPSARMLSIEPSLHTFAVLDKNRAANPQLDWETLHCALWHKDGQLFVDERDFSTSNRVHTDCQGHQAVPAMGLDSLLKHIGQPVDLLKIDVEGAEEAIICGQEHLLRQVSHLVLEIHPQLCDQQRVISSVRSAYKFIYRIPGRQSSKPLLLASRQTYALPELV